MEKIGLQLYSIKEVLAQDFLGGLEKLAKMGYDGVEFAGYYNTPAKELKKALDSFGLKVAGSHVGVKLLKESIEDVIEYSLEIGNPYVICPALPPDMRSSADDYKKTAELLNTYGEKCRKHNITFGYHNHDFEFNKYDGKFGLDILVENTQPENLIIELDTFWVEYCDLKSVDFIQKYGKRCSLLHIKDMKSWDNKINTEIGKGVMDFKEITSLGKKLGVDWYTIEQEEFEIPMMQSVEEGLNYLRSIL